MSIISKLTVKDLRKLTVKDLKKRLGLKPGKLLTNSDGEQADILEIDGDHVLLGVLTRKYVIRVPLENLRRKPPK